MRMNLQKESHIVKLEWSLLVLITRFLPTLLITLVTYYTHTHTHTHTHSLFLALFSIWRYLFVFNTDNTNIKETNTSLSISKTFVLDRFEFTIWEFSFLLYIRFTHFVHLAHTTQLYPETLINVDSIAWNNDNKTIYYVTIDHADRYDWHLPHTSSHTHTRSYSFRLRPYKLWKHTLGTDPSLDTLLYHGNEILH
jgi:protease II